MASLTARQVATLKEPGRYGDGNGLYLEIGRKGGRYWILRTVVNGRRRDIGLGSASLVPLREARERAQAGRRLARDGGDPLAQRQQERAVPAFREAAETVWREQVEPTARNAKHKAQWLNTLRDYAFPLIGGKSVAAVDSADVLRVLQPIWLAKPETARRVRQRLRTVFDWAIAAQHREARNPVDGIEKALAKQGDRPEHHAAMPHADLPALMARLAEASGVAALALRFAVLTAARSGEVRGARWSEIDPGERVWTVPEARMKGKRPHRVPLSPEAMAVLAEAQGLDGDLVFPGMRRGTPLSDMSLAAVLKRLCEPVTVHGFRSTFRDWAAERTNVPREIAEHCLAHIVAGAVERAYQRSDLFEKRRGLMDTWAAYATQPGAKVVRLGA